MDYTRQIWKDHIVEKPRTYTQTVNSDGSITLAPAPGEIIQQGTPINAEHLNHIEDGVAEMNERVKGLENGKASTAGYTAILPAAGWSSGNVPYGQEVAVPGILETDNPFVDVDMSGAYTGNQGTALTEAWSFVGRVTAKAGSIAAYCYEEKPTVDIPLVIRVVR